MRAVSHAITARMRTISPLVEHILMSLDSLRVSRNFDVQEGV